MRPKIDPKMELGRLRLPGFPMGNSHNGAFSVAGPGKRRLVVIISNGAGWEHASVHVELNPTASPTWEEMCFVKDLVWLPTELVVQYHVPTQEHINLHTGTLHMWRLREGEFPVPPKALV